MKRWSLDKHACRLFEAHHGKFVRFTDHAAEVVRLEARIAELEVKLSQAGPSGGPGAGLTQCDLHDDESR
jgi:hypothetical protein